MVMKPSGRIVSFLLCVVVASSAAAAAQAVQIESPAPASAILDTVVRNALPPRSALPQLSPPRPLPLPQPRSLSGPGNGRLYLGMAAIAGVGVGLIAYGSGDSTRAVGYQVRTQGTTVRDYDLITVNRNGYKAGGVALIGVAAFGIYAIHKWRR